MRIAVLADIHGNPIALDAVLADARGQGVEEHWVIGDFSAIGPDPVGVLEKLDRLERTVFTRGNTDRYTLTGEGPPPTLENVKEDPELVLTYAGIAASFAWTRAYLEAFERLDSLARLPLEHRTTTPSGLRILAVHAAPGTDDGEGVHAGRSDAELVELLAGADADVVFVAHTHEALLRRVGDVTVVNPGSVSNPKAPDLRAAWVLLELTTDGIEIRHRRVDYDRTAFIESVRSSGHPSASFILGFQDGESHPRPPHTDHTPLPEEFSVRR